MRSFALTVLTLGFYGGHVAGNNFDDAMRGAVVDVFDSKSDVKCREPILDKECPRDDITFWLYTRDLQNNPHQLNPRDENTIRNAPFVQHQPLKILVHGYTMNRDTAINQVLRPAYFKNFDYNIISVDWSAICPEHCYREAALSVPTVGVCLAKFVQQLGNIRKDLGEFHVLGHSMGAHVTSWASQDLDLAHLTQFDPALPLFADDDKHLFLKPKGRYVDVWHTNSGLKGRDDVSGTVDIYFNDGQDQPGCKCDASCSHLRAVEYYAETVYNQVRLKAFPCRGFEEYQKGECPRPTMDTLVDFGEWFTPTATGTFLAFTNDKSPFIINGEDYTVDDKYNGFKKSRDLSCTMNDVQKDVGKFLHV